MTDRDAERERQTTQDRLLAGITLDHGTAVPLHHQISSQLRRLIADGRLAPNAQLPQVQALCRDCGVSIGTVTRAFLELKKDGLIVTRRGKGAYVADRPIVTTELILTVGYQTGMIVPGTFFHQIIDGLRAGLPERRRYVVTHFDGHVPTGHELAQLCALRHADSLVFYRPAPAMLDTAQRVAGDVHVVSLFWPIPQAQADCVRCDPRAAMRRVLADRLARGCRRFVYAGPRDLLGGPVSPYREIYEETLDTLRAAGVQPEVHILPVQLTRDGDVPFRRLAPDLPADCVVVAATPHIAAALDQPGAARDLIAYTEHEQSVQLFGSRVTLLYLGLKSVGRAAAELLAARGADPGRAPRTCVMEPVVLVPGQSHSSGGDDTQ